MNQQELRRLALSGVDAEIARLTKLREAILSGKPAATLGTTNGGPAKRRGGRQFTAAQRREVSKRMKAMWAKRRKE
jgi:hypothetical protein